MTRTTRFAIGTRGSPLALAQAEIVRQALIAADPSLGAPDMLRIEVIRTTGDRVQDRTLAEIGGKGLFTKEIEEALLAGTIDLAVHSMKDVATILPERLVMAALLPRADPRDVLIAGPVTSIGALPQGAVVGTASLRRGAQMLAHRPDLRVVPLRGNVQTRLAKVERGEVAATLLAAAGLARLGLGLAGGVPLSAQEMVPAVAQGAIGLQCRAGDGRIRDLLHALDDGPTSTCVAAERSLLATLDGSCRTPIAGHARLVEGEIELVALLASPDGRQLERTTRRGPAGEAVAIGVDAGRELLGRAAAWPLAPP